MLPSFVWRTDAYEKLICLLLSLLMLLSFPMSAAAEEEKARLLLPIIPTYPCNSTVKTENGTYVPDESKTELLFIKTGTLMGRYAGVTPSGFEIDETWYMNDGLVNTVSATAPFNAPQTPYIEDNVAPGVWNVVPVYDGDHMSLQGGLFKKNDVRGLYTGLLTMINSLEEP